MSILSALSGGKSAWLQALQPASWRGQTIYIDSGSYNAARSTIAHIFPYRDTPFIEDLGRAPRELRLNAYLVSDDDGVVWDQRDEFISACEDQVGVGELIHPSRGSLQAVLTQCQISESKHEGGVVNIELVFIILDSDGSNSDDTDDTQADLTDSADKADKGFFGGLGDDLKSGVATISSAAKTAQGYVSSVKGVLNDATRSLGAINSITSVFGLNLGRYINAPLNAVNNALRPLSSGLAAGASLDRNVTGALTGLSNLKTKATDAADNIQSFVTRNL